MLVGGRAGGLWRFARGLDGGWAGVGGKALPDMWSMEKRGSQKITELFNGTSSAFSLVSNEGEFAHDIFV